MTYASDEPLLTARARRSLAHGLHALDPHTEAVLLCQLGDACLKAGAAERATETFRETAAVARALSGNVKLLLLDEPFEGLAPAIVQDLFRVFDRLRAEISIVIVEHNLDLVLALADRVFALERGAVVHAGPAQPLLTDLDYRKKILWL